MNGRITIYCKDVAAGVVMDAAGRHYLFNLREWKSGPHAPRANAEVVFNISKGWAYGVTSALMPPEAVAIALSRRLAMA